MIYALIIWVKYFDQLQYSSIKQRIKLGTMLNSSSQPFKLAKINQYIMRRRARNLRAKVKALLPVQICCKHDHRNRCVQEIHNNKKVWETSSGKSKWTMSKEKQNCYYFENQPCIDHCQRFQKLTEAEIEQIKQDRLYYLGEQNLADFQLFLQGKNKDKQFMTEQAQQLLAKTFQNFLFVKPSADPTTHLTNWRRHSEESQFLSIKQEDTLPYFNSNNKVNKVSVDQKLRQFEQRRKYILVEQKSKRLMDKVKLNMRLERAETKLKQIKQKKISQLELRRLEREEQLQKITGRKRNYDKKGEIKQIQAQLRRTFLNRISKTANFLSRTARNQF